MTNGAIGRLLSGPEPEVHHFASRNEEREFLADDDLKELVKERKPEEICLVARTNSLIRDEYGPIAQEPRHPSSGPRQRPGERQTAASGWRRCTGSRDWSSRS